jgi:large subunit ribosomal protein L25
VVRPEVELIVNAKEIPSELIVDLSEFELGDTINISNIKLPEGAKPTITGRDFVIANIQAPSGLKSSEEETSEETTDDPDTDTTEETDTD